MKNIRNCKPGSLIRIGLDPKLFPSETLFYWLIKARNPVLASDDPLAKMFIAGMLTGEKVQFIYWGGSQSGSPRNVNVSLIFQHEAESRIYVAGFCHERQANRVFALDLVMAVYASN
jgi:hypothetical protein